MDALQALVLGVVQGLTEFLPVSSDGHLALAQLWLGIDAPVLAVTILLHAGTLLATLLFFRDDVLGLLRHATPSRLRSTDEGKLLLAVVVGSVPTALIGFVLKDTVEELTAAPHFVAFGFLGSAIAVLATRRGGGEQSVPTLGQALAIGVAQGLAVLPGLSRSGSTIAAAMLLGLRGPAAFRFSFLLSLPAVGGALLLEAISGDAMSALPTAAWLGVVVSFVVGVLALHWLRRTVASGRLWTFALYLVPLAVVVFITQPGPGGVPDSPSASHPTAHSIASTPPIQARRSDRRLRDKRGAC